MEQVKIRITRPVMIHGRPVKSGAETSVSQSLAKDLLRRGKAVLADKQERAAKGAEEKPPKNTDAG